MDSNFVRSWLWTALLVLAGLWLLYVEVESAAFQQCVLDYQSTQPREQSGESGTYAFAALNLWRARVWTSCTGVLLDTYREAVIAVATLFIAIFAWALWWATRRLGRFARQQAADVKEALGIADKAVQAAFVSADANEVLAQAAKQTLENERAGLAMAVAQAEAMRQSVRPWVFAQPWPHTARVDQDGEILFQLEIACHGNAPATVTELSVDCRETEPAGEPSYAEGRAIPMTIPMAPNTRWLYPHAADERLACPPGRRYVVGYIRYRDQRGDMHVSGFCVRLVRTSGAGDPATAVSAAGTPAWSRFD